MSTATQNGASAYLDQPVGAAQIDRKYHPSGGHEFLGQLTRSGIG
jgi:hypothetical protein